MFAPRSIKHCRACGGEVRYQTPADDNRDRATCIVCTTIHYENPLNVVGTLPVWEDKVLLCRRAIEPRHGLWTLPAGFMELGETTAQGAIRETTEEAGARVELEGPLLADQRRPRRPGPPVLSRAHARRRLRSRGRNRSRRSCSPRPRCRGTRSPFGRPG
jgi:ADP-ribose pyrophosphatase YjhB (NUDIX family)